MLWTMAASTEAACGVVCGQSGMQPRRTLVDMVAGSPLDANGRSFKSDIYSSLDLQVRRDILQQFIHGVFCVLRLISPKFNLDQKAKLGTGAPALQFRNQIVEVLDLAVAKCRSTRSGLGHLPPRFALGQP